MKVLSNFVESLNSAFIFCSSSPEEGVNSIKKIPADRIIERITTPLSHYQHHYHHHRYHRYHRYYYE